MFGLCDSSFLWAVAMISNMFAMTPSSKNANSRGCRGGLNVLNAGRTANPTRERDRGSCRRLCINSWATSRVTACSAYGGRMSRGARIWKRQSSVTTDDKIAMHSSNNSRGWTASSLAGDAERERDRAPRTTCELSLRLRRGRPLESCRAGASPESLHGLISVVSDFNICDGRTRQQRRPNSEEEISSGRPLADT